MDTIGVDTCPLSAGGADAAVDTVDEQERMLPLGRWKGNPFPERGFWPAGGRETGPDRPLAHARSPRDNRSYRAAFSRVETTDARAKRPTMSGSNEPPFLLP